MKIIVTANAREHVGYDLDKSIAYLNEMDRLRADPTTKLDRIQAALRMLGQPMPAGAGTAVVALFPEVRKASTVDAMDALATQVYANSPWARRAS